MPISNRLLTRAARLRATTVREWFHTSAQSHAVRDLANRVGLRFHVTYPGGPSGNSGSKFV